MNYRNAKSMTSVYKNDIYEQYYYYLLQLSCHSVAVVLTLVQTKQIMVKVKVNFSRYRPGVAQRVGRGIALLSMTAALEGG